MNGKDITGTLIFNLCVCLRTVCSWVYGLRERACTRSCPSLVLSLLTEHPVVLVYWLICGAGAYSRPSDDKTVLLLLLLLLLLFLLLLLLHNYRAQQCTHKSIPSIFISLFPFYSVRAAYIKHPAARASRSEIGCFQNVCVQCRVPAHAYFE